jgi:hypothetical protein
MGSRRYIRESCAALRARVVLNCVILSRLLSGRITHLFPEVGAHLGGPHGMPLVPASARGIFISFTRGSLPLLPSEPRRPTVRLWRLFPGGWDP